MKSGKAKFKAIISLIGATLTATLSMIILYESFVTGGFLKNYGLISVSLAALFSHLTIIARGLFIPVFLPLTKYYNPLILGLAAGLGGAFGEMAAYYWGLGIKEALDSDKEVDSLPKWAEKYGLLAALLFAASPLPDTPIMLLAGSLQLPIWKLLLIQLSGKTIFYSLGAVVGDLIFMELKSITEEITVSAIILIASLTLCVAVSWRRSREKILYALSKIMSKIGIKM